MTEWKIAGYTSAVMSNFLSAITIYFLIITAYVVTAFIAGTRLTKTQLVIVNITFSIAAGITGTLSHLIFSRFYKLALRNQNPVDTPLVDFGPALVVLIVSLFIGCFFFMWTSRRMLNNT